ncbi:MAG: serine/threonine-protein kinase [Pirellulaceae bacterium]
MTDLRTGRLQELFLAALEVPEDERESWLVKECGSESALLESVLSLLGHAEPSRDPLEQELDEAIADLPRADLREELHASLAEEPAADVDCEHFLSKLSEVGVLSPDEFATVSESMSADPSAADPRQLASQLVTAGKLTEYQASALLKGEPELLIDKYLILDLIDVGGMGMVFKAIHRTMNRVVAVKMISQQALASSDQVKRFQREVRVTATLEHPNIVRSYDADESRGVNFLVMEYVRGKNLHKIVRTSGPLSLSRAVDCTRQAAVGLQYAHERGIVHRDIKPGNLLLDDHGTVKILDLGLAHFDETLQHSEAASNSPEADNGRPYVCRSELTAVGMVLGTASFMAPEQSLDSHLVDSRSDVYSLGCALYFLLTGDTPYTGNTVLKVFVKHREAEIPALRDKRPDVPASLEAVFRRMIAKNPDDRFQSMSELILALDECRIAPPKTTRHVETKAVVSPPASMKAATNESAAIFKLSNSGARRIRLIGAACLAALLIVLVCVGSWLWTWPHQPSLPDAKASSTDDRPPAADTIALEASAADLLASGKWEWQIERNLGAPINSPTIEFGADMSADGLTIVISSLREEDPHSNRDLWISSRPSRDAPWPEPVRLPSEINSEEGEVFPRLSADGLTLGFLRGVDWWVTTRADANVAWSRPIADPIAEGIRRNYDLTADGLTAFRSRATRSTVDPDNSVLSLFIWRRDSLEAPFGDLVEEPLVSDSRFLSGLGTLSNDGRMYIFPQDVNPDEERDFRLFVVTRSGWNMPWSAPVQLFDEESVMGQYPRLLNDGKTLLFVSDRAGGQGRHDVWLARLKAISQR